MAHQREATSREQADLKVRRSPDESATRLHEKSESPGGSECHGEYVPGLVHTAVTPWEWVAKEVGSQPSGGAYHRDS